MAPPPDFGSSSDWCATLVGLPKIAGTMSDASSLRTLLRKTDGSAPAIQQTAGAMMKHYDKSAGVAVVEWRNALHQARLDQHLPLLYVANEALQNSKRNRGNKFLEAFSPVLGQSLAFICQNNPEMVEKVRRTVKIWGDRHVFSVRYVNELLKGLEAYRNGGGGPLARRSPPPVAAEGSGSFSPLSVPTQASSSPTAPAKKTQTVDFDKAMAMDDDDGINNEDEEEMGSDSSEDDGDGDSDNEGGLFGDSGDRLLNIELDLDKAATAATSSKNGSRKRRRPSGAISGSPSGATGSKSKRRPSILSTNSLMELWNQVSNLQQRYDNTQTLLAAITPSYLDESSVNEQIDTLVGDELLDEYKKVVMFEKRVVEQRKELHKIANKRKVLEQEAIRYLPWLEAALKQDQDDIEFCDKVTKQLKDFSSVHVVARAAREERLADEERRQKELEEEEQKKREEEERRKFMESAMSRVTEAQPGMVWNKATGEYQYLHTDESWRD